MAVSFLSWCWVIVHTNTVCVPFSISRSGLPKWKAFLLEVFSREVPTLPQYG